MVRKNKEKSDAHRTFKFYKATGKFPPDISPLDAYILLNKYNYFIARDLDEKKLSRLKKLNEFLANYKIVIAYGDFTINLVKFALESAEIGENESIRIEMINGSDRNFADSLVNSIQIQSLDNSTIIYIIDNIDQISEKKIEAILQAKKDIMNYDKFIVCCALELNKVNKKLRDSIRSVRIGESHSNEVDLKKYVNMLFHERDRNLVSSMLKKGDVYLKYFLNLCSFNLNGFYKSYEEFNHNLKVLRFADMNLFTVNTNYIVDYLVNSLVLSERKSIVKFPPKIDVKKEGKVKITMTLTSPGCPLSEYITKEVEKEVKKVQGVKDVDVELTFDPPWTPEKMTKKARKQLGF